VQDPVVQGAAILHGSGSAAFRWAAAAAHTGVLTPVRPGLLRFTAAPTDRRQQLMGAVLLAGDGAVLSHRTAAIGHGTHQFSGDVVEVSVPVSTYRRLPGIVVHRTRRLPADQVARAGGIPVTTPARTLVDLAGVLPEGRVARQIEEWLADRKVTVAGLFTRRMLARTRWLLLEFTARRVRRQPDLVVAEVERHRRDRRAIGLAS
jgi:hypothetical protein